MTKRSPAAFTLVECVLALAVVSLSVLLMVALLPSGLECTRVAVLQGAEARVIEHLQVLCQQGAEAGLYYFDADGTPQAGRDGATIFAARLTPEASVNLPGDAELTLPRTRAMISHRAAEGGDPFAPMKRPRVLHLLPGGGS
ncbi:MAG: hypothetical protein V4662_08565 [Verrucomicrobiota bacterium]